MVRSIRQLESLRDAWDEISAPLASPLLDHDWFLSCAESFYADGGLSILTTSRGGAVTGIAPLAREGSRLVTIGASRLYEPSNWLGASDHVATDLTDLALRLGRPLVLSRFPADAPVLRAFTHLPRWRAVATVRPAADSLAVPLRGTWDAYHAGLSSRITTNLPRLRRKAERTLGPVRFERQAPAAGNVDGHLERFVAIEGSGWKGRRGSSLASRGDLRDFFRRYCLRAAAAGRLRVSTLSFGPHIAAMEIGVEAYRRLWQLKIGYEDSLAAYYPGLHLTWESIRCAFDDGLDAYEFLGSAEAWENRWQPETRGHRLVALYPASAAGFVGGCHDVAAALWRRTRRPQAVATP